MQSSDGGRGPRAELERFQEERLARMLDTVLPAVLTFRLVGFWLPIIPGVIAYFALRKQVNTWGGDGGTLSYTSESKVTAEAK